MAEREQPRLTTAEILAQIPAARARAAAEHAGGRRAVDASYDPRRREMRLTFPNGTAVGIPVAMIDALAGAPARALRAVEVSPSGASLHFEALDVDLSVPGLLGLALKGTAAVQALGSIAGSTTSAQKAEAARVTGKLGGRPRKVFTDINRSAGENYGVRGRGKAGPSRARVAASVNGVK